ncbi:MAG: hypothetical protein JWO71_662 [Candidatus Acidoferrum typicum]|nr:hypothetical protein [Candidatus Acidoferrum typicum]
MRSSLRTKIIGNKSELWRMNVTCARRNWGGLSKDSLHNLAQLTDTYRVSVTAGHLQLLDGRWYITHSGLLYLAFRRRCGGIKTTVEERLSDPVANRWVFKATVYKCPRSKGFVGYGDADPSNVSTLVHGAEMRIAETRAVNRALRKAYGIGVCSVEELGSLSTNRGQASDHAQSTNHSTSGSSNGQPRLRDQLCLLIRQHNLDPTLVKAYAADFCGTPSLKEANRDLVQSFISHLTACAKESRDMLVCRLNSYAQPVAGVTQ